ncbi:MAG TPA: chitobiase/beta-hexosaminidase C-terminal domain-containing protein [Solirubrobacteraceae bacterium]
MSLHLPLPPVLAAALLAVAALAPAAPAAVVGADKAIVVTTNTSDIALSGFADNAPVKVVRDGVVIATATNRNVPGATPAEGGVNSAHVGAAGGCWTGFTPQLLPGDEVRVGTDSTVVHDVTADPLTVEGAQLVVHGTAVSLSGARLPADEIDAQLHSPGGRFSQGSSGGQFLSATAGDLGGVITYDAAGSTHWTARWPSLGAADSAFAFAGTVVGAWTGPAAAAPNAGGEETDFEAGATPGPIDSCADAPYAPDAVTGANHEPINAASAASDLVVTGSTQPGVTAVRVALTDAAGKTVGQAATLTGRSWSATFPATDVAGLADGAISAAGAYKLAAGTIHGATRPIVKDTVAPVAPTATVPAGSYGSAQSVELAAERGATIRYTTDGSDPSASSPAYASAVPVTASQTLKAIAIDAAGNASPVAAFGYVITPAAPGAGAALPGLHLEALRVRSRLTLRGAHRRGVRVTFSVPDGTQVVRVRLVRGRRVVAEVVRTISRGRLFTVVLPRTRKGRRALRRGAYRVAVAPGRSRKDYGVTSKRTVRIR